MNNLPKVVTQQRRGRASNPRLDRKSDALPLSHRATPSHIVYIIIIIIIIMKTYRLGTVGDRVLTVKKKSGGEHVVTIRRKDCDSKYIELPPKRQVFILNLFYLFYFKLSRVFIVFFT